MKKRVFVVAKNLTKAEWYADHLRLGRKFKDWFPVNRTDSLRGLMGAEVHVHSYPEGEPEDLWEHVIDQAKRTPAESEYPVE